VTCEDKMKVPFLDLNAVYAEIGQELTAASQRVGASGWYLMGAELEGFEADFAQYCGSDYCAGVGSGLDALILILRALEIGPGDEVIVPAHTFIATWLAVSEVGARPVPVECDERSYTIDPAAFEAAITSRTAAVIPVHLYGQPADMDAITEIAARHQLAVVEDASQAHGARYRGQRVGTFSTAAAFSLNPVKNLGAWGNAGAVVSNDYALTEKIRLLRNYGYRVKYQHEIMGINSRLDEIQAAVLRVKLRYLDEWNARRRALAACYLAALSPIALDGDLVLPFVSAWAEPVWHQFVIRHHAREAVQEQLRAAGIETLIHYPVPVHLTPAYRDAGWREGDFPVAERLAAQVLSLPISPQLPAADAIGVAAELATVCRTQLVPST
jgi:dTDP-3-amino-3,4,6-trideoxy-alpha-D-glucose transaminase